MRLITYILLLLNSVVFSTIHINQCGYIEKASKICIMPGDSVVDFSVKNFNDGKIVYRGTMKPIKSDFGAFVMGDFSKVTIRGKYFIYAEQQRSYSFIISDNVYDDAMHKILNYFQKQRCGNTSLGYLASPCHLDDSLNPETGEHVDMSGAWHDASDLRKWVSPVSYGMHGLFEVYNQIHPVWDNGELLDELRWGNAYFHKMQSEEGYFMTASHLPRQYNGYKRNNSWTDNIVGNDDDRILDTRPVKLHANYRLIKVNAELASYLEEIQPDYAKVCFDVAEKCDNWLQKKKRVLNPTECGTAISAYIALYNYSENTLYRDKAVYFANELIKLQETEFIDKEFPIRGFFYTLINKNEPYRHHTDNNWHIIALCDLVLAFPNHPDVMKWKNAIKMYCDDFILPVSGHNIFGLTPYGIYLDQNKYRRQLGSKTWYRYFKGHYESRNSTGDYKYLGMNANIAGKGIALIKAAKIFKNNEYAAVAQRQLDWILGMNPFNKSTMVGVGKDQPIHYTGSQSPPKTPMIEGAVRNGIVGDVYDDPDLMNGSWQTCEYWTPMVGMTAWLFAEITSYSNLIK